MGVVHRSGSWEWFMGVVEYRLYSYCRAVRVIHTSDSLQRFSRYFSSRHCGQPLHRYD